MPDQSPGGARQPVMGVLGQAVRYAEHYDPALLFPVSRQPKRLELRIDGERLPFAGEDLWNAYEISWLNPKGKPQVAVGEFRFPASTPCIVESKSLKLYLNSLNQSVFPDIETVGSMICRDLSAAAGGQVRVALHPLDQPGLPCAAQRGGLPGFPLDVLEIACEHYVAPRPDFLKCLPAEPPVHETVHSRLLKSNCLVTGQPDWASIVIEYRGNPIDREGLLQYIVSFRQHNEFHEQCVERIFRDVLRQCQPENLSVWARYTRRGGLDINPWRTTRADFGVPSGVFDVRQ